MRTTIQIDNDIYTIVRSIAEQSGISLRKDNLDACPQKPA